METNHLLCDESPLVGIVGPLTTGNLFHNVFRAAELYGELLDLGFVVFCPHINVLGAMLVPRSEKMWLEWSRQFVRRCDAIVVLNGVSKGTPAEVSLAEENEIPVFREYQLEALVNHFEYTRRIYEEGRNIDFDIETLRVYETSVTMALSEEPPTTLDPTVFELKRE